MKRLRISAASSFISSLPVDWLALVVMTTDGCFWVAWAKNTGGQTWLVGGRATHVWNICIYFRGHYPSLKMEHKIYFTRPSWLILLLKSPFHADWNPFLWTNHFKVDFPLSLKLSKPFSVLLRHVRGRKPQHKSGHSQQVRNRNFKGVTCQLKAFSNAFWTKVSSQTYRLFRHIWMDFT